MLSTLKRIREERADAVLTETYIEHSLRTDEMLTLLEGGDCNKGNCEDPVIADIIDKLPEDDTTEEVIARIVNAEGDPEISDFITPMESLG